MLAGAGGWQVAVRSARREQSTPSDGCTHLRLERGLKRDLQRHRADTRVKKHAAFVDQLGRFLVVAPLDSHLQRALLLLDLALARFRALEFTFQVRDGRVLALRGRLRQRRKSRVAKARCHYATRAPSWNT